MIPTQIATAGDSEVVLASVDLSAARPTGNFAAPPPSSSSATALWWLAVILIALAGIFFRVYPSAGYQGIGFDELLYRTYVLALDRDGFPGYPRVVESFIADQGNPDSVAKLPPTRVFYMCAGWIWKRFEFGDAPPLDLTDRTNARRDPVLVSLHRVTCCSSVLLLLLSGVVVHRMFSPALVPGVLLAMACAPLQLHMSQHALMDGFFALWAMLCLWAFWENLRHPEQTRWLVLYGVTLGLLVLSKENAFFVFVAILGLAAINPVARFGTVTRRFWMVSALVPLAAMTVLVVLAGGVGNLAELFQLLVTKFNTHEYAIRTGAGPWHRYLVDELVMSPFIVCLAIGGFFTLSRDRREFLFMTCFVIFTYAMMCNVRHGMNLRFTTIWDLPLRILAVGQLAWVTTPFGARRKLAFSISLIFVCAYGLWQYWLLFVKHGLFVTPSESLLRAVEMVR